MKKPRVIYLRKLSVENGDFLWFATFLEFLRSRKKSVWYRTWDSKRGHYWIHTPAAWAMNWNFSCMVHHFKSGTLYVQVDRDHPAISETVTFKP